MSPGFRRSLSQLSSMERSFNVLPVSQYILDGMYRTVAVLVVMYSAQNMFSQRILTMETDRVLVDGVNAAAPEFYNCSPMEPMSYDFD